MNFFRSPAAKSFFLFSGVLIVVVMSCWRVSAAELPAAVATELEALEKKRQMEFTEARKPLTELTNSYLAALERTRGAAKKAGVLKKVLAADEEIKRVKAGDALVGEIEDPKLARLRKTYIEHRTKREIEVLGKIVEVERRHADALAEIVKTLTQAGMLAVGKHVLGLEEAVRESIKELAARIPERPSAGSPNSEAAPPEGFALIPAGPFKMGDHLDGDENAPVHTVIVSAFYIAQYHVTKTSWDEVRLWGFKNGYTDLPEGRGKDRRHPVHSINWYDAVRWCNARSEMEELKPCYRVEGEIYRTGQHNNVECDWSANGYRLPTEAEWEKAARGGLEGKRFPWGDTISHKEANFDNVGNEAYQEGTRRLHPKWQKGVRPMTSPVGSFPPNGFGLHDMAGNVYDWCWDWWGSYPSASQTDPRGPTSGSYRVLRGGGWSGNAFGCRSAYRVNYVGPGGRSGLSDGRGFRPARSSVP